MSKERTMKDAWGNEVPARHVPKIDKERDRVVERLVKRAEKLSADIAAFKEYAFEQLEGFAEKASEQYGATVGGKRGNLQLTSFDGTLRVSRDRQDRIAFDERLSAAQCLLDEWLTDRIGGIDADLRKLVDDAFHQSDGGLRTARILALLRLDIKDDKWRQAMELIKQSIQVASTRHYVRCFRKDDTGEMVSIPLDIARV